MLIGGVTGLMRLILSILFATKELQGRYSLNGSLESCFVIGLIRRRDLCAVIIEMNGAKVNSEILSSAKPRPFGERKCDHCGC